MKLTLPTTLALVIIASATLACTSSSTVAGQGGSDAAGGSGGTGSGGTGNLGCTTTDGCADDAYCDFPDGLCGGGEAGVCEKRPMSCSDGALIVCSCKGTIEYAGCQTLDGFDDNIDASACTDPGGVFEDVFACGDRFCRTGVSYCQRSASDVAGTPDDYACMLLPSACDTNMPPTCACLQNETCGDRCEDGGAGAVTLTCPGG